MNSFLRFSLLFLLLLGSLFVIPMLGRVLITPQDLFRGSVLEKAFFSDAEDTEENSDSGGASLPGESPGSQLKKRLYWELRFPRTVLAMLVGAGLSLCGMVFQALFRNPLATPYTLGVASGAAFGSAVFTIFGTFFTGYAARFPIPLSVAFAFFGAFLTMVLVFFLSRSRNSTPERMLLAGVAVNFFFSSMILFLQYISDPAQTFRMLRFTMGGFETASAGSIAWIFPLIAVVSAIIIFSSRSLNVILTGEDRATSLGIDIRKYRAFFFFLCSLTIGGIVALAGPIGFVGIMVPHISRLLTGPDHRVLAPTTFFLGAIFLAFCDLLSRTVIPGGGQLPVGIITSMLGGPFFLLLLMKTR